MTFTIFHGIIPGFPCNDTEDVVAQSERIALLSAETPREAALIADDVVDAIMRANTSGLALRMHLDSIVGTYGWTENVAK
jgi:ElaB/YqjD/DUF883 family membrane-anchored ribosome-binding protein